MCVACENKSLTLEQMRFDFGRHLGLLGGTCRAHAQPKLRRSQSRKFILNGRVCVRLFLSVYSSDGCMGEKERVTQRQNQRQRQRLRKDTKPNPMQSAWRENSTPFLPTFNLMCLFLEPAIDVENYEWTGSIFISPAQIPQPLFINIYFFSFYFRIFHMFMFIMFLNLYSKFYLLLSLLVLKNKAGP